MGSTVRAEAIATLEEGHGAIADLFGRLSQEQFARRATIGGGDWSAADLAGHMAHWEELALEAIAAWRRGEEPRAERIFRAEAVDGANAEDVERKRALTPERVREGAEATHRQLVREIATMSDEEWTSRAPYETERPGRLEALLGGILGAPRRPFGHASAHLSDLEDYVDSLG